MAVIRSERELDAYLWAAATLVHAAVLVTDRMVLDDAGWDLHFKLLKLDHNLYVLCKERGLPVDDGKDDDSDVG